MKTFESKFEDYYVALGNAEQVRIYNHFAGANLCPLVYDSEDIDEVFENLTPKQIVQRVRYGNYQSFHDWFYLNEVGHIQGIEIVSEWLDKYIPAMAKYYHINQQVLLHIDADTIVLFSDNEDDYARHIFDKMTLDECIEMWNESACDHYQRLWKIFSMDDLYAFSNKDVKERTWDCYCGGEVIKYGYGINDLMTEVHNGSVLGWCFADTTMYVKFKD